MPESQHAIMTSMRARVAVSFEPVCASDLEALVELRIAAMRESLERVGRFEPGRARARLVEGFSPADTWQILAGAERVGFYALRTAQGELWLDHLYVAPAWQGQGVGGAALRRILATAEERSLAVRLSALKDSPANAFYAHYGFELVEQQGFDNYYRWSPL